MSSEFTPSDGFSEKKIPFGDPRGIAITQDEDEESVLLFHGD